MFLKTLLNYRAYCALRRCRPVSDKNTPGGGFGMVIIAKARLPKKREENAK
jgi:hypothetical protein